jgi:hypothetical protein
MRVSVSIFFLAVAFCCESPFTLPVRLSATFNSTIGLTGIYKGKDWSRSHGSLSGNSWTSSGVMLSFILNTQEVLRIRIR